MTFCVSLFFLLKFFPLWWQCHGPTLLWVSIYEQCIFPVFRIESISSSMRVFWLFLFGAVYSQILIFFAFNLLFLFDLFGQSALHISVHEFNPFALDVIDRYELPLFCQSLSDCCVCCLGFLIITYLCDSVAFQHANVSSLSLLYNYSSSELYVPVCFMVVATHPFVSRIPISILLGWSPSDNSVVFP